MTSGTKRTRSVRTYWIERRDQLQLLCSPVRQDIVDTLAQMGPTSVAELARRLGRRPESLYYHLRALVQVGLVLEHGERRLTHRSEKLYRTPGRTMRIRYRRSNFDLHLRSIRATLRLGQRDVDQYERTLVDTSAVPRCGRVTGWLTRRDLREIEKHLTAIVEIMIESEPKGDQALYAVSWLKTRLPEPTLG